VASSTKRRNIASHATAVNGQRTTSEHNASDTYHWQGHSSDDIFNVPQEKAGEIAKSRRNVEARLLHANPCQVAQLVIFPSNAECSCNSGIVCKYQNLLTYLKPEHTPHSISGRTQRVHVKL